MENQESSAVSPELIAKIERKQKERLEQFTKLKNTYILTDKAKSIVQLPTLVLQKKLQSREFSAQEVLQAFTAKALEITEKFNCVTEFIPQALEWASALDNQPATTKLGPLFGMPVAVKDDHDVEGMDTTMGYAKNLYKPATESAALVKILLKLGAVPFAKTNVPQSIFSSGSDNPIFGTTLNAHNPNLAPGGSSSGSGCIVAAGGAPFATGSDLGGSLRIPSHFHGLSTVRPTGNRLSDKGVVQCVPELVLRKQDFIFLQKHTMAVGGEPGVPGIIAPDAETLSFVWKAITENNIQNLFDPMAVPMPWNETLFSSEKKLKIGYFTSLPFFPAFEDTKRTVLAARDAFQSKGHTVVEFQMPDDFHYLKQTCDLLLADQGRYLTKMFSGEPISYCVADLVESIRKSNTVETRSSEEAVATSKSMTRREKFMFSDWGSDVKTAGDLWNLANEQKLIKQDILERMEKAGIDLILSPSFPYPAVKLHDGYGLSGMVYTVIWNFVNFPAGVVGFGTEKGSNLDDYNDENDSILKKAKKALSESVGMPITVQIIGRPYKEELVLRAMVELEKCRK